MEDYRQQLFAWRDRLAAIGQPEEDEQIWRVRQVLTKVDLSALTAALTRWALSPALTVKVMLAGESADPCDYDWNRQDVSLPEPQSSDRFHPCQAHALQYQRLFDRQEAGQRIDTRERLTLLIAMTSCETCRMTYELWLDLDKPCALGLLAQQMGHTVADQVLTRVWLSKEQMQDYYTLPVMLQWPERCVILVTGWDMDLRCDYVRTVNLADERFWERFLVATADLVNRQEDLKDLLMEKRTGLPVELTMLPLPYWVSRRTLRDGRFSPDLADCLHARELLALGLVVYCATRVQADVNAEGRVVRLTVVMERDVRLQLVVSLTPAGIKVGDGTLDLRSSEGSLLDFYQKAVEGTRPRGNQGLVQTAVTMVGDGSLLSLLTRTDRILAYYEFQYQSLLDERFKQQMELSNQYLARRQEAGAKVTAAVNDLYKNLAAILTGIGALAVVVLTTMIKDPANGNYLVFSGLVLSVFYVPAYLWWSDTIVQETLDRLTDFEEQMRWSAKMLKFPEERLHLPQIVDKLVKRIKVRVGNVLVLLGVLFMASNVGAWYGYFDLANWLKSKVPSGFGFFVIGWTLLISWVVWRRWQSHFAPERNS